MNFRLYILLFCVTTFVLTAIGLAIVYTGNPLLIVLSILAYVVTLSLVYAFFVHPLLTGDGKLSSKKFLLFTFSVIIIAIAITHSVWTIITPKWAFSVTTDKSAYSLDENVKITVYLKNIGFITHSFKSGGNPVVISIEYQYTENPTVTSQVWYTPYHINTTVFSIRPNDSLERNFIWNQTNIHSPEKEIKPGIYQIKAYVPSAGSTIPSVDPLFWAWTSINITSSK